MSAFDRFAALSFDCYGTLIDWETGITTALRAWLDAHGADIDRETLLAAYSETETVEQQARPELYPLILARVIRRLGERFGVPVSDTEAGSFGASVGDWPAFPDSAAALARLKRRFRLVILSNVDRASFARSNERLAVEFDAIVTAEDVGTYKPDPRNFVALLTAVRGLGVEPGGLLHVAESLFHDHVPGKAAGLATAWIDRRGRPGGATPRPLGAVEPDWTFSTLAELADAVDAVGPSASATGRDG